jgi:hypothetical protein
MFGSPLRPPPPPPTCNRDLIYATVFTPRTGLGILHVDGKLEVYIILVEKYLETTKLENHAQDMRMILKYIWKITHDYNIRMTEMMQDRY